ncbi:MAG: Phosphoribosylanthranilate isomerase [Polyangiaceae bacterium]|jgi:phosphoribosylanthranilate isomerase|nr:Phosphoribosylanthranilate isomerase [Polyangiaceae bacterium]
MTWTKICGLTSPGDAEHAARSGASAIGLNFVHGSKRRVTLEQARPIVEAVRGSIELVAVVANPTDLEIKELLELGIDWLQLHGEEPPARVSRLLPHAFKAVAIEDAADARRAASFPGERLLVDTKVSGTSGGTGKVFDWQLVTELARQRQLILAGGLTPKNVATAVRVLAPWGVDTASGVELVPGVKDPELVTAFVLAVRGAV